MFGVVGIRWVCGGASIRRLGVVGVIVTINT